MEGCQRPLLWLHPKHDDPCTFGQTEHVIGAFVRVTRDNATKGIVHAQRHFAHAVRGGEEKSDDFSFI